MDGTREYDGKAVRRDIALFVLCAYVCRAAFMLAMRRVIDTADAIHYLNLAEEYAAGNLFATGVRISPLYPALCAGFHLFVPDIEWAGRLASLAMSGLLVAPVYLLSNDLHGRRAARISALMVCLWPWLTDYGSRIAPEAAAMTLWFFSVWGFARSLRRGGWWLAAAPVCFFALSLVRPEGILLLLAAPVGGLLLCTRPHRRRALRLIPFVAVAGVLLAGVALYMRAATGTAAISHRVLGPADAVHHAFVLHGAEMARALLTLAVEVIPLMIGPYLLLFAGVGLFRPGSEASERDGQRDYPLEAFVLYFAVVQAGAAVLSAMPEPRYIMAVAVVLSLWAARGLGIVGEQAAGVPRHRWLRRVPVGAMAGLMLLGLAMNVAPEYTGRPARMPREYRAAGRWMKENLEPGLVFSRKPQVGFYADMPTTGPGADETVDEALARARAAGARYVVVDERYTTTMLPAWQPLLDPANAPASLRLLEADLSPYATARIVIYEFRGLRAGGARDL